MSGLFVAIIGTQSSGSSAIAGVAYHVGVWMGNNLGGRYGRNPDNRCGFEDRAIFQLMKKNIQYLKAEPTHPRRLTRGLRKRIHVLQRQANAHGEIAGAKEPRLSRLGDVFHDILGNKLRVIDCDRPLVDAIKSLQRRQPNRHKIAEIQRWLWNGKQEFLSMVPPHHCLTVPYYSVLADPEDWARQIADFLGLAPTTAQIANAVHIVHPQMNHIQS